MTATYIRQALEKTLRSQLEKTVTKARTLVEKAARDEIERLGVGESRAPSYLQPADAKLRNQLRAHGRSLGDIKASDDTQQIGHLVGEVAYEHWHRMLFAYFLIQNNLLMCEGYPVTLDECTELAPELGARNGWEAAGLLAAQMLPQVFRASSPALKIVLPIDAVRQLEQLIIKLHPDTFQAQDALGWLYQFWQSERKAEVNASGVKIGAEELSPVTQLFTEPYMVSFLLDNALGAWWANRKLTQNDLTTTTTELELRSAASVPGVPLTYLRFIKPDADQPPSEQNAWTPAAGTFEQWPDHLQDLTVIDPCCGSGHFLVAAFLMLVPLRMADEGLTAKEAITKVLSQNLHGLELDQRCVELAAFAIALEAWRYPDETGKALGYRKLPELQLACSGIAIGAAKGEWKQLAKQIAAQAGSAGITTSANNLGIALDWLQKTFEDAPVLGSLINPRRSEAAKIVDWPTLENALNQALDNNSENDIAEATFEAQVAAQGLTKAAQLLSKKYSWVITNVPYLGLRRQTKELKNFLEYNFPRSKGDLATVFMERYLSSGIVEGGHYSVVTPSSVLTKSYFSKHRENLLNNFRVNHIAILGTGAFGTISGEVVDIILIDVINFRPSENCEISIRDVSEQASVEEKSINLSICAEYRVNQSAQLSNPNFKIQRNSQSIDKLLIDFCSCPQGIKTGDDEKWIHNHWEVRGLQCQWHYLQSSPVDSSHYLGANKVIDWRTGGNGMIRPRLDSPAIGQKAVGITQTGSRKVTIYTGQKFDSNIAPILPVDNDKLISIYTFCSSKEFQLSVAENNRGLYTTNTALMEVPFDAVGWSEIANLEYPNGLPQPYTNDPTQWIFHGHPCGSVVWSDESKWTDKGEHRIDDTVLQVAIVRLLGYRWPAELDSEMELAVEQREWVNRCDELLGDLVDDDGIVCLPALRGEDSAAHRLELMLEAAYGDAWSNSVRSQLLDCVGAKSLEVWLRDKFFEQHCKLFQHRPFIWQIWDGVKDGFSALVNYHQFDGDSLDRLIYTYLNDWIGQQAAGVKNGESGAEVRLSAAQVLKTELEAIKQGEASSNGESGYDIFVRWKPLHEQPVGWEPDLNDGVRLNIRPFMTAKDVAKKGAGILRAKPNIHWKKDRGTDVASAPWYHLGLEYGGKEGDRINDHHLTRAEKLAAREAFAKAQAEQEKNGNSGPKAVVAAGAEASKNQDADTFELSDGSRS